MRKIIQKGILIIGIVLGGILIIFLGYASYLLLSYRRIPDDVTIDIENANHVSKDKLKLDIEYSALSYNIGFGAYSSDYSFFMDGGEYSRAFDKESVLQNTQGAISIMKEVNPTFLFLQEVDLASTRSYQVNQKEIIIKEFPATSSAFAINFDSAYLFYPFFSPHGKSKAGLLTVSDYEMKSALRRSLPISKTLYKFFDLDRCYVVTRIPVDDGKELCLYNVHLSAYTDDAVIVQNQIKMLAKDMKQDLEKGNYIVCGGDFNQDMYGNSPEIFWTGENKENWALPFPEELLTKGMSIVNRTISEEQKRELAPSCRNANAPYVKGESFVTMVDGFLVSENVEILQFDVIDHGFAYSDHNPVLIRFRLFQK